MYTSISRAAFVCLLLATLTGHAQTEVSIGYMGHGVIRPGAHIGLDFPIKTWQTDRKEQQMVLNPSLGIFTRSRFYTSGLLNTSLSFKTQVLDRKHSHAFGIGLGYLARNEVMALTTDFAGGIISREKELRNFIMPSIHYAYRHRLGTNTDIYSRLTYGKRYGANRESAGVIFMELGLYLPLQFTSKEHE